MQFDEKKIYLNSQLNILDIVQLVGTNRTYITSIINRQYNQNFCNFVNSYRVDELKKILLDKAQQTNETLAELCGFGSVISMKRAVLSKEGMSFSEWRQTIYSLKLIN